LAAAARDGQTCEDGRNDFEEGAVVIERIDESKERWNVLRHPFYRQWDAGGLTREELRTYAGEYAYAVRALAHTAAVARDHAEDEAAHVDLWERFRASLGDPVESPPSEGTHAFVRSLLEVNPLTSLGVLYAVESSQPDVARTKLDGLVRHYGYDERDAGLAYFRVHAELDVEHAARARTLLEERVRPADEDCVVEAAERALAGNWALLDSVAAA
jgi:pyrroloquinoline-quinone synthase